MPPFNTTLPYSVYSVTDGSQGGSSANEDLATTLINGNNAGTNDIDMNNQNIQQCNNLDTNIVDALINVNIGTPQTITMSGVTGDITCHNIVANDIICNDFTSTGTLSYNLLNPAIPAFQPSSFTVSGSNLVSAYTSGLGYDFSSLLVLTNFSEAPPLPSPQPTVTLTNGLYANGLAGWYRLSCNCFPTLPAFDYFININIMLNIYSNATGTPPANKVVNFYTSSAITNITAFVASNSYVAELQAGWSAKWEFNCTTQSGLAYQMAQETQISGELISKGV